MLKAAAAAGCLSDAYKSGMKENTRPEADGRSYAKQTFATAPNVR